MYRLMIADDEDDERMGIKFLLNKCGFEFDITEASDGREALEKIKSNPVDILFTDVKMPFLSGIELSTEARKLIPGLHIIFFSGFDDFEYVKQALSLQAVDYILKPVNPAEFQKIITKVTDLMIQEEAESRHSELFHKNYILSRLLNQVTLSKLEIEYTKEQLQFLTEYSRMILLEFEEDFFGKIEPDIRKFGERFQEIIPCEFDFLDMNPTQGILFVKASDSRETYYRDIAQCIHLEIEKEYGKQCYLSFSLQIDNPDDIGKLYSRAETCLEERFFYRDTYVYPLDVTKRQDEGKSETDGQILQAIQKDVSFKDMYSLRKDIEILFDKCRNNSFQSYVYTRFICSNLLKILFHNLPEEELNLTGRVEEIYSCNSFLEVERIIWEVVDQLEINLAPKQDSPKHMISLVEQYILKNYKEDISLDILAEKVFLTPHYLSSIFIQEKGIGINKYIKNVRMEKSKELLLHTNMKINDICEKVGYSNLSYFCRTFRNEYGTTPEKYRHQ